MPARHQRAAPARRPNHPGLSLREVIVVARDHTVVGTRRHIGGVAAGVHPVGRTNVRTGPTGARCLPAPKGLERTGESGLGTRAPWVRPTTPPVAPSGQRAADVRPARSGTPLMQSCFAPSVIGRPQSGAGLHKPRDARYLDRGTTRWYSRAPARQGPSSEERHRVSASGIPSKIQLV